MMADPANDPQEARASVLAQMDQFVKTGAMAMTEAAAKKDAEGGDDEPEPGETEPDEQVEAGSEGDDEQEPGEAESQEQPPQKFKVKVDGQELEVTLDEALAGYSREADYTRKSQAFATERQQWEANRENLLKADRDAMAQERERYKEVLDIWDAQLKSISEVPTDWDALRRENPAEWSARMTERRQQLDQLNAIRGERQRLAAEERTKLEGEQERKRAAEVGKMLTAIPEWKDQSVYLADSRKIFDYGQKLGYSPQELGWFVSNDHRVAVALRDAVRYHELQTKKPEVQKKVEAAKPLPAGATQSNPKAVALDKLRKEQAKRGDRETTARLFDTLGLTR